MRNSYKVKLKTNKRTNQILRKMAGTYRQTYNTFLWLQEYYVHFISLPAGTLLSKSVIPDLIKAHRKDFPFINEVESGIVKAAASKAYETFTKYFAGTIFPYASRKREGYKFQTSSRFEISEDGITIPKLGKIKFYEKGYVPVGKMKASGNVHFSFDGKHWWLSFSTGVPQKPIDKSALGETSVKVDFTNDGNIVIDGEEHLNVVYSQHYQKLLARHKRLLRKLKRQAQQNVKKDGYGAGRVPVTTENTKKTRIALMNSKARLENMRLDYFRKVASDLSKTKTKRVQLLSNDLIRRSRNGYLSRSGRVAGTAQFFDVIRNKLKYSGVQVERLTPLGVRPELQVALPLEKYGVPSNEYAKRDYFGELGITSSTCTMT